MKNCLLLIIFLQMISPTHAQVPKLLGAMSIGSTYGIGDIIKINGDGTGFTKVYSCMGGTAGGSIQGNFLPSGNSLIYGVTVSGGTYALGDIYSYNTTTNTYLSIFSMDSSSGFYPRGSLTLVNNKLYGLTSNGGTQNAGVFFSLDLSNNQYVKLHEFDVTTGLYPNGSVTFSSSNGKLYGMTTSGGTSSSGVIFSYDIAGNTFSVVHEFDFTTGFAPFGTLLEGDDGLLYGMTFGGGSAGFGVIFSLNPSNNALIVIHTFDGINGSAPFSSALTESSGILYGCTSQGGSEGKGVLFSLTISSSLYAKLHDFTVATGSSPYGGVTMASDGKLYGMTLNGGANNLGSIYSFDLSGNTYTKLFDGSFADGALPYADLVELNSLTGTEDATVLTDKVRVYPVPTHRNLTVQITNFRKELTFVVTNHLNQKVFEEKLDAATNHFQLNLPPGIYFYTAFNNNETASGKLVIQ